MNFIKALNLVLKETILPFSILISVGLIALLGYLIYLKKTLTKKQQKGLIIETKKIIKSFVKTNWRKTISFIFALIPIILFWYVVGELLIIWLESMIIMIILPEEIITHQWIIFFQLSTLFTTLFTLIIYKFTIIWTREWVNGIFKTQTKTS